MLELLLDSSPAALTAPAAFDALVDVLRSADSDAKERAAALLPTRLDVAMHALDVPLQLLVRDVRVAPVGTGGVAEHGAKFRAAAPHLNRS